MLTRPVKRILVMASTFPASETDASPAFVKDLVLALKQQHPEVDFAVLAPQVGTSMSWKTDREVFVEYRFPYAWPRRTQLLTGSGILPTLTQRPWLAGLIPFLFFGESRGLKRVMREWKPDVIHAHWFTPQGIVAARASEKTGIPLVLTSHASDVSILGRVPGLGRWIVRRWLPRATRMTAVSRQTLERARQFFDEREWSSFAARTRIIPMGVEQVVDVTSRPPSGSRTILFIGRLVGKKGIPVLIDAMTRLDRPDVQLIVAGSGPDRQSIETAVSRAGLRDRVEFPGFVTGDRKASLIASADAIVVPSVDTPGGDTEGLPVVLLEALSAGVPCIATDVSGASEVIEDGVHGWIVRQGDPEALADAIRNALDLDETSRNDMASRQRERARRYAWPEIARQHWDFLFAGMSIPTGPAGR